MTMPEFRAPTHDREILAYPPLEQVPHVLEANRILLDDFTVQLFGRSLADLRRSARAEVLKLVGGDGRGFAPAGWKESSVNVESPWFVAGHQPEFFHPGVWFKNFVLAGLARRQNGFGLNVIIDNDTAKSLALKVPSGGRTHAVPFDVFQGEIPWEECQIRDQELFQSFPERLAKETHDWPYRTLARSVWDHMSQAATAKNLGERMVSARRALEGAWGVRNVEIPLSEICRTSTFARFACHLMVEAPFFHRVYNQGVHDYRKRHGIKSKNHPVPDLARQAEWLEMPFWAWIRGESRRRRLWVRHGSGRIEVRADQHPLGEFSISDNPAEGFQHALSESRTGYKIRSRALTTTMYLRLFLADVFLHGIGGGKYDELTDLLIENVFGLKPPRYFVLSATLLLPLATPHIDIATVQKLARELRDLHYNPQRHLPPGKIPESLARLVAEKTKAVHEEPSTPAERKKRFQRIRALTDSIRPSIETKIAERREELARLKKNLAERQSLRRRDFSFVLYSEETLRSFFREFI